MNLVFVALQTGAARVAALGFTAQHFQCFFQQVAHGETCGQHLAVTRTASHAIVEHYFGVAKEAAASSAAEFTLIRLRGRQCRDDAKVRPVAQRIDAVGRVARSRDEQTESLVVARGICLRGDIPSGRNYGSEQQ